MQTSVERIAKKEEERINSCISYIVFRKENRSQKPEARSQNEKTEMLLRETK